MKVSYLKGIISYHRDIKSIIHVGHFGIERCINHSKMSVFWPNMNKEIDGMVSNCSTCLTHRNVLQQESMIEHDVPDSLWIKV